jgi:hypothetical protein
MQSSVRASQETQYVSATKPNWLMLLRETVAVCCENHMERINTNAEKMQCCCMLKQVGHIVTTVHGQAETPVHIWQVGKPQQMRFVAWPIFSVLPWTCKHSEYLDGFHVTVRIRYRVQLAIKPSRVCRNSALELQPDGGNPAHKLQFCPSNTTELSPSTKHDSHSENSCLVLDPRVH